MISGYLLLANPVFPLPWWLAELVSSLFPLARNDSERFYSANWKNIKATVMLLVKQTSKRANEQTSKRASEGVSEPANEPANERTSQQTNERASERASLIPQEYQWLK